MAPAADANARDLLMTLTCLCACVTASVSSFNARARAHTAQKARPAEQIHPPAALPSMGNFVTAGGGLPAGKVRKPGGAGGGPMPHLARSAVL